MDKLPCQTHHASVLENAHTQWLRKEVLASLNDPSPKLSHAEACQKLDANLERLRLLALRRK